MTRNEYRFLDRWKIHHPIELVWPRIVEAPAYPAWWGEVYERVTPLNDLPPDCVGSRMRVEAHGRLPYRIRFIGEVTRVEVPHKLGLKAEGDLVGEGLWTLAESDFGTAVTFEWTVRADKLILRWFSPILKPLFAWNHRWTMQRGEAALNRLLSGVAGK